MNFNQLVYVFLILISLEATAVGASTTNDIVEQNFVEPNPKYKPPSSLKANDSKKDSEILLNHDDNGNGDEETTDSEEDDDDQHKHTNNQSVKGILETSLFKTQKTSTKTLRLLKKYHTQITIALILYAFRKELWNILVTITTKPSPHGKGRTLKGSFSPTSILKVLLFIGK